LRQIIATFCTNQFIEHFFDSICEKKLTGCNLPSQNEFLKKHFFSQRSSCSPNAQFNSNLDVFVVMVCCKSRDHMTKCRHEKVCGSICLRVSKHKKDFCQPSVQKILHAYWILLGSWHHMLANLWSLSHGQGIRQHICNSLSWISWEPHKCLLALSWPIGTDPNKNTLFCQWWLHFDQFHRSMEAARKDSDISESWQKTFWCPFDILVYKFKGLTARWPIHGKRYHDFLNWPLIPRVDLLQLFLDLLPLNFSQIRHQHLHSALPLCKVHLKRIIKFGICCRQEQKVVHIARFSSNSGLSNSISLPFVRARENMNPFFPWIIKLPNLRTDTDAQIQRVSIISRWIRRFGLEHLMTTLQVWELQLESALHVAKIVETLNVRIKSSWRRNFFKRILAFLFRILYQFFPCSLFLRDALI
jgi:hypothetical protein